jgi:hypothetical protein
MSYGRNCWAEELPNPWHDDCRGKFIIYEHRFDSNTLRSHTGSGLEVIHKHLQESGKLDFFENNNIDFNKSCRLAALYRAMSNEYSIYVFVDLPSELRVLYTLTFTE